MLVPAIWTSLKFPTGRALRWVYVRTCDTPQARQEELYVGYMSEPVIQLRREPDKMFMLYGAFPKFSHCKLFEEGYISPI